MQGVRPAADGTVFGIVLLCAAGLVNEGLVRLAAVGTGIDDGSCHSETNTFRCRYVVTFRNLNLDEYQRLSPLLKACT